MPYLILPLTTPSPVMINWWRSKIVAILLLQHMSKLSQEVRGRAKLKCPLCARSGHFSLLGAGKIVFLGLGKGIGVCRI
jgi:hypothetical protein